MGDFTRFDRRNYRTVDARTGYGEWVATYEDTVRDEMDLALLDCLASVDWAAADEVADLGCGTGRTGAWLAAHGAQAIDGVDLTPEMLDRARARGVFRTLRVADATASGLPTETYDLVTTCLVDEHLADLDPLYAEAFRLARPGGTYAIVGYHPFFLMASGMPTHYDAADGEPVAIETHLHMLSDHVAAAHRAGLVLQEMLENVVDEAWLQIKPRWGDMVGQPFSFALVWRRPGG